MAKNKKQNEQLDLIDFRPENIKEIIKCAKEYRETVTSRIQWLEEEKAQKAKLLQLVRDSGAKPVDDTGKILLVCDGLKITVTPRDELIQVKDKTEEASPE